MRRIRSHRLARMLDVAHRRVATLVVASLLTVGLVLAGLFIHVPYVELSPNQTCDTLGDTCYGGPKQPVIEIDPKVKQYPTHGHLNLTVVSVRGGPGSPLTPFPALRGWLGGSVAVVPEDLASPPGQTAGEVECENTAEQLQSQNTAITV